MKYFLLLCPLFFVTACSTGIVPIGNDTYMISRRSAQIGCGAPVKARGAVYQEAQEFCAQKNGVLETVSLEMQDSMPARPGSVCLTFKCISPEALHTKENTTTFDNLPIVDYNFSTQKNTGFIAIDLEGNGVAARHWIVDNIGKICSEKNITMVAGQENRKGGHYKILNESLTEGLLTIEFEAVY